MFGGHVELHSVFGDLWAQTGVVGLAFVARRSSCWPYGITRHIADGTAGGIVLYAVGEVLWDLFFARSSAPDRSYPRDRPRIPAAGPPTRTVRSPAGVPDGVMAAPVLDRVIRPPREPGEPLSRTDLVARGDPSAWSVGSTTQSRSTLGQRDGRSRAATTTPQAVVGERRRTASVRSTSPSKASG